MILLRLLAAESCFADNTTWVGAHLELNTSCSVIGVLFIGCYHFVDDGSGGAITTTLSLKCSDCCFNNCSSASKGGAISDTWGRAIIVRSVAGDCNSIFGDFVYGNDMAVDSLTSYHCGFGLSMVVPGGADIWVDDRSSTAAHCNISDAFGWSELCPAVAFGVGGYPGLLNVSISLIAMCSERDVGAPALLFMWDSSFNMTFDSCLFLNNSIPICKTSCVFNFDRCAFWLQALEDSGTLIAVGCAFLDAETAKGFVTDQCFVATFVLPITPAALVLANCSFYPFSWDLLIIASDRFMETRSQFSNAKIDPLRDTAHIPFSHATPTPAQSASTTAILNTEWSFQGSARFDRDRFLGVTDYWLAKHDRSTFRPSIGLGWVGSTAVLWTTVLPTTMELDDATVIRISFPRPTSVFVGSLHRVTELGLSVEVAILFESAESNRLSLLEMQLSASLTGSSGIRISVRESTSILANTVRLWPDSRPMVRQPPSFSVQAVVSSFEEPGDGRGMLWIIIGVVAAVILISAIVLVVVWRSRIARDESSQLSGEGTGEPGDGTEELETFPSLGSGTEIWSTASTLDREDSPNSLDASAIAAVYGVGDGSAGARPKPRGKEPR